MTTLKIGPIRNLKAVEAFLKKVPHGTKRAAVKAIAEYMVGDGSHGLSHDDPYRQTTRKAVYGQTFESDAQRRYVMAAIKDGRILIGQRNPIPTKASSGYEYKITQGGYGATITNSEPGAYWSRGWGGWKNWRNVKQVISANMKGAMRHATAAINLHLRNSKKK